MAYVKINPIKTGTHLSNTFDYIKNPDKTNDGIFVDSYECPIDSKYEQISFYDTINKAMKKGNNIAWHIKQSFAPEDKVTPEMALEIGKETMKRMYPNYQYIIATHIDKDFIHNHIVMCSVNLENYKKLHSNKYTLNQLRNKSDELCAENGLSVIEKKSKNHKNRLKENIDKSIQKAESFTDFITIMQGLGYQIKLGKYIAFKDENMQRFMRGSSISIDYTEALIRSRISNHRESKANKKLIYDDKLKVKSKRKILKMEIDESLKKSNTFDEFIDDMRRKGFEAKRGKHLAFLGKNQERYIRTDSLSYHYSEDVLRFRIENREVYEKMMNESIGRVINRDKFDGGLYSWAGSENVSIRNKSEEWLIKNVLNGESFNRSIDYAIFMEKYEDKAEYIKGIADEIESYNAQMRDLVKAIKAIEQYWELKPIMDGYKNVDINNLSAEEKKSYNSNIGKWNYSIDVINKCKDKYGTLSINELRSRLNGLKSEKGKVQTRLVQEKLEFETWENVKYNYEDKEGYHVNPEKAKAALKVMYNELNKLGREETRRERKKIWEKVNDVLYH